jgi:hypothetical protein
MRPPSREGIAMTDSKDAAAGEGGDAQKKSGQTSPADAARRAPRKTAARNVATETATAGGASTDAIALLKADHRKVEQLFEHYASAQGHEKKAQLAKDICRELIVHTRIEEEIFYPACRGKVGADALDEAQVEHDGAKVLIAELLAGDPDADFFDAKVKVLSEEIRHHVKEEEAPETGIFAKAEKSSGDLKALGQKLVKRKQELLDELGDDAPEPPATRSFTTFQKAGATRKSKEETTMADQGQNYRERDERGRFTDDDDDNRYASQSRNMRSNDDRGYSRRDEDRRQAGSGNGYGNGDRDRYREREDDGRFTSSGDERSEGGSRSPTSRWDGHRSDSRNDSRGQGGQDRNYGQSMRDRYSDYDDDRRNANRNDEQRGGHGNRGGDRNRDEGGRFTSGNNASRSQGYERDDDRRYAPDRNEGRGWYGDRDGHSEAARRGWSSGHQSQRRNSDFDGDMRDDRHDHGGWYGDSQGHADASRRGWQGRR